MVWQLLKLLPALSRSKKRTILVAYDLAAMMLALWAAFSTRLGLLYVPDSRRVLVSAGVSFLVGLVALYRLRIYHIVLRYFDLRTVTRILTAAAIALSSKELPVAGCAAIRSDEITRPTMPAQKPENI